MKSKWVVVEKDPISNGTRVFNVKNTTSDIFEETYSGIDVWWNGIRLACCRCQGITRAMLSDCIHCKQIKRFLNNS